MLGAIKDNAPLRRLLASTAATSLGKWGFNVALAVYAYRHGGAALVGLVALLQAVPSVVMAPVLGLMGDRFPRQRVLLVTNLGRGLVLGGLALASMSAGPVVVIALAVLYAVMSTANQPARAALLPTLAQRPEQLSVGNAAMSSVDNLSFLIGSGAGGVLLAATSVKVVVGICALAYLLGSLLIAGIPTDRRPVRRVRRVSARAEALAGFGAIAAHPELRLLFALIAALSITDGVTNVLVVVSAIQVVHLGTAGVGYLNAAYGAGGLLAGGASLVLLRRSALSAGLLLGSVVLGLPLALVGVIPAAAAAAIAWAAMGLGYALVKTAALVLLQRLTADRVLSRVLGVLETTFVGTIGLGAILAPLLVKLLGARGALVAAGSLLPVLALLRRASLRRFEAGAPVPGLEFDLLRAHPIFAPLPLAVVEELSRRVESVHAEPADVIIRQGDVGDRWYLIAAGEVEVSIDGTPRRRQYAGEGFGEIALLRDVPRTATVRAVEPSHLLALGRDAFLAAVTGLPDSREAADEVASRFAHADRTSAVTEVSRTAAEPTV